MRLERKFQLYRSCSCIWATSRILRPQFWKKCEALLALGGSDAEVHVLVLGTCFSLAKWGLHCQKWEEAGLGAPLEGVDGFPGEGNLWCRHLQWGHWVKHRVQLWTWSMPQSSRATRCGDLEAEVWLLTLKPPSPWGKGSQQLCAGEWASLVQSRSPGTAGQLAGTVLGTIKIPILQAEGGEDTLHPGFGAEIDPAKDQQLLLLEGQHKGTLFSLSPGLTGQGSSSTLSLYLSCPS